MRNVELHRVATMGKRIENDFAIYVRRKSDRPIDRRTFSVGMSVLDEAIRRILKTIQVGSLIQRPWVPGHAAALKSVAPHATTVKNTGEGERFHYEQEELNCGSQRTAVREVHTWYFSASLSLGKPFGRKSTTARTSSQVYA